MAKKTVPSPPKRRLCGATVHYFRQLEIDPGFRKQQLALEKRTTEILSGRLAMRRSTVPLLIQVVVHIVYSADDPSGNISDSQVRSQLRVLNEDYRAKNADRKNVPAVWQPLVADANIEFALATKDPAGQPTTGITRTKTDKPSFSANDKVKFSTQGGIDAWPAAQYLNIWVCSLANYLGYAQFPGGKPATDGVVILHTAFGTEGSAHTPFNKGRTATHEVGHWLNLRHIWGDTDDCTGSDFVADTPKAKSPNYGSLLFPHLSCSNGPNGDMFMNYMDYVDDNQMFMFTQGQVARMLATLTGPRASLV